MGMALGKVCDRSVPGIGFGPASSYRLIIIRGVVVDFVVVGFSSPAAADFLVFAVVFVAVVVFVLFAVINDDDNIGYSK